jgi:hypothetical protein
MTEPHADWRSSAAYEDKRALDAPGFAFEFLRRNPEFIRHHQQLSRALSRNALTSKARQAFARRWGIRFRGTRSRSPDPADPVDGDSAAQCRCAQCNADRVGTV